ncbi:MAG: FecR domain-containing protein [Vulcanimicrobiaceae bacterium]
MRRALVAFLSLSFAVATLPAGAAADKTLENLKGNVSYQITATAASQPIAPQATISLADNAFAVTGPNSMGAIGLPDSSRVLVGQSSRVQLVSFTQTNTNNASFVLVPPSRTRFEVQHPSGAHANYTFQTPLGQIAVRGTVGDIYGSTNELQVNVYDVSDPTLPVVVTMNDGKVYILGKGDVLDATLGAAGVIQVQQEHVNNPTFQQFQEFGMPQNAQELGLITNAAAGAGAGAGTVAAVNPIWALALPIIAAPILVTANHATSGTQQQSSQTKVPITTSGGNHHRARLQIRFFFPIPIP